ncbi:MAG: 16S rRNA (adenine(1518)-N(6)/adenine(1519)-N(6))-dimethyltransferase RsmA [Acidimicrobiales bacterium]|nr:16S rRNA (adenine(1518)-N(6)/adenine(1519)-N(6))-dimethyltransferase RsmA [Acidimicrobiales bacterium]
MTHSRPTVYRLLEEHELHARRELGQNFVADPNTVRRIAELAQVGDGDHVVEIGPGLGSLTLALAETGASVVAVEVDPGLAAAAQEVLGDLAVVIEADARTVDWASLHPEASELHVVANLPYNIGTSLVIDILANVPRVRTLCVLVQTEVAERFAATPGSSAYGIPSVLVARYGRAEIVAHVPASVFVPRPKVESALARIVRHEVAPTEIGHDELATAVRMGFGQRRKMIRKSLKPLIDEGGLRSLGLDPTARAEELSLLDWVAIAERTAG